LPYQPEQIRNLRQRLGMTQRELARLLGVPQSTVQRWESGEMSPSATSLGRIDDLAREHGVPFTPFLPSEVPQEPQAALDWLRRTPIPMDPEEQRAWSDQLERVTRVVRDSDPHASALRRALEGSSRWLRRMSARTLEWLAEGGRCEGCGADDPGALYRSPSGAMYCLTCLRREHPA
jgi:transcriptional regulator with XRE-family HTH domain